MRSSLWIPPVALAALLALTGCPNSHRVRTESGKIVRVPNCRPYVSRSREVGLSAKVKGKVVAELSASDKRIVTLEDKHQHYALQMEHLCGTADSEFSMDKGGEWLCKRDMLSTQMNRLIALKEGLDSAVKLNNKEALDKLFSDYYKQYFAGLDYSQCKQPASGPAGDQGKPEKPELHPEFHYDGDGLLEIKGVRAFLSEHPEFFHRGHAVDRTLTFIWLEGRLYSVDELAGRRLDGESPSSGLWMGTVDASTAAAQPKSVIRVADLDRRVALPMDRIKIRREDGRAVYSVNVDDEFRLAEAQSYEQDSHCEAGLAVDDLFFPHRFDGRGRLEARFLYDRKPSALRAYRVGDDLFPRPAGGEEKALSAEDLQTAKEMIRSLQKDFGFLPELDPEKIKGGKSFRFPTGERGALFDVRHSCY